MERNKLQVRGITCGLKTRAEPGQPKVIEGYFAVFGKETELFPGAYEEIAIGTFDNTLSRDIRALINHETTLVLGRTKVRTLELSVDAYGLYGKITINENDSDAMNLYERVARGDVDQCSFGFEILHEEVDWREDGTVKWIVKEVNLFEVSVCTFPAYEETAVHARSQEYEDHQEKQREIRKNKLKERLKNGIETIDVRKED